MKIKKNTLAVTGVLLIAVLISSYFAFIWNEKTKVHCRGQVHFVFGDNETLPEFKGVYTFFFDKEHDFISVNGLFSTEEKTYAVQKVIKINAALSDELPDDYYDLKVDSVTSLTGDNLPDDLSSRYILGPVSVISIRKQAHNTFIIKNLYAPVLLCHSVNDEDD